MSDTLEKYETVLKALHAKRCREYKVQYEIAQSRFQLLAELSEGRTKGNRATLKSIRDTREALNFIKGVFPDINEETASDWKAWVDAVFNANKED